MSVSRYLFVCWLLFFTLSALAQKRVGSIAEKYLLEDPELSAAHIGISVYDVSSGKDIYNYQGDKFFVPASNTKIMTCYAAMKYLDSVVPGVRYYEDDTAVYLRPTGDPSLLHRDFMYQPVIEFLQRQTKKIYISDAGWKNKPFGPGWAWDDYNDAYMTEKNALPVYGNTIRWVQERMSNTPGGADSSVSVYSDPEIYWKVKFMPDTADKGFSVMRDRDQNIFSITQGREKYKMAETPFVVNGIQSALELLRDTIGKDIFMAEAPLVLPSEWQTISSCPIDSLLRPMMYRSDNFIAEQLLSVVSESQLGVMDDETIIEALLTKEFAGFARKPEWVDGSGLSRYNLFTPKSLVYLLNKMRTEFGMERIKTVFPSGGDGTLTGLYLKQRGALYAKTGTLSGVVALSGYLYAKDKKLLVFSVVVNNFNGKASVVRRKIERFISELSAS
ncbi:MAG TPA: D-alanyl-D-alanine carboxypeptidase/D-alanyl-D-alanine-endopeptidase [Flavitalea sp.]|nr:D-alanyl-D-alanine carboxypeptidase/D-alanyl-D-alanine-endopeptidase [Flavitalea sp.]